MTTRAILRQTGVAGGRLPGAVKRGTRFATWTGAALLAAGVLMHPAAARSAEQYQSGDAIEVYFLREWRPAVVIETNRRGEVLAEFEFAGVARRQGFKRNEVRLVYEVGALAPSRFWSDASGKFRTRAVLLSVDGDSVTLRKPDMTEITVPISKLSDGDQRFIKRLEKEGGPAPARPVQPPPIEQFDGAGAFGSWASSFEGTAQRAALEPDPVPGYRKLKQGGVAFPTEDFFDRVGAVLPIGGPDVWLLAAVENETPSEPLPTRLLWASLERQKIEGRQLLPPAEIVMDYHPPSHRLLTYATVETPGNAWGTAVLTLWEVLPTDKQVKAVVRWNADAGDGRPHSPWARLADGDTVVQRWTDHEFVVWDAAGKQVQYRTTQESFFAPAPTLSGGGKYLFLPEDERVRILESATGRLASTLPVDDGAAAVAVSDDGRHAAVLGRSTLTVWDLTDPAAEPTRYQAEAIGTPFHATLNWVGDRRVMADTPHGQLVLFSLHHKLTLWRYDFDMNAVSESEGRRVREIAGGHLVYAATVSSGSQRGLAVGAVTLPGPRVDDVASSLDRDALMIIKPGTAVRLDVRAGGDTARVEAALQREIEANGWKLSPSASTVVIAEMKRGETQRVTYRSMGAGRSGSEQTITVTPYISTVRIEVGGNVAWQSGTSSGAPPIVTLKQGESAQGEVNRWQRPNAEFFESVDMPERILDPAHRNGLGMTQVTNRGLIAQ